MGLLGEPAPLGWQAERDLQEACHHVARARRLSPLDLDALEKVSRLAGLFGDSTAKDTALARLRILSPSDPAPWFWAGQQALARQDREEPVPLLAKRSQEFQPLLAPNRQGRARTLISRAAAQTTVLPSDPAMIVRTLDEGIAESR